MILEIKVVLLAFLFILFLPVIAVLLLTQVGINLVSDKLVNQNPVTQTVQIKDPTTGEVVAEINPSIVWPTKGIVTLEFSKHSPFEVFHTGIDIAGKLNDPVNPVMEGIVTYAGSTSWGYGKHIMIDHGNNLKTIYAHLNKIYVYKGQKVQISDIIGAQGQTGWSTGVHLHFQVNIYGIPVNPRVLLK